jgi:hypothetical protein
MFRFEFDEDDGILVLRISGTWTDAEVLRLGREIGPQFSEARRKVGALRFLVDKTQGEVIPEGMGQPLIAAGARVGQPDDRVAMLVSSSLMKSQSKQVFTHERAGTFVSENAARTWLTALAHQSGSGPNKTAA